MVRVEGLQSTAGDASSFVAEISKIGSDRLELNETDYALSFALHANQMAVNVRPEFQFNEVLKICFDCLNYPSLISSQIKYRI